MGENKPNKEFNFVDRIYKIKELQSLPKSNYNTDNVILNKYEARNQ